MLDLNELVLGLLGNAGNAHPCTGVHKGGTGSGYHGPRPGTGRPGEVGGSRSVGSIPDDQLQVLRNAEGLTPIEKAAIEKGFQEFARDAEERVGEKLDWEVAYDVGIDSPDITLTAHTRDGGRVRFQFGIIGSESEGKSLDVSYVSMPRAAQQHGMGLEIVDNIRHIATEGGFNDVVFDATSAPAVGFVGAYVWAKMGAGFALQREREYTGDQYEHYLRKQGLKTNLDLHSKFEPGDIAREVINGRNVGKEFLITTPVSYHARVRVQ